METALFDWSVWDCVEDTLLQFYGCTLKVPIGSRKVGDLVSIIVVDFEHGILQVFDKERDLLSEHKVR